jgi:hypothetical protein
MNVPPPIPVMLAPRRTDHTSVWQLVLGIISFLISIVGFLGLLALYIYAKSGNTTGELSGDQIAPFLWLLAGFLVVAFVSIIMAARGLSGHVSSSINVRLPQLIVACVLLILWVALVFLGSKGSLWNDLGFATVPVKMLSIFIPVFVFASLALFRLQIGSKQRGWALLNVTLFVSLQVIMFIEIVMVVVAAILIGTWVSKYVDLTGFWVALSGQGSFDQSDLQYLVQDIEPLFSSNMIIALCLAFFSILVPLVEELFKPLAVWFLAGKKLTPSEGFAAGIFCGAAYGLIESLMMLNVADTGLWQTLVITRVGTGLLHILTAGLSGWALAKTWQDQKYIRMALMYAGVVLLHGIWNMFAIFMGLNSMTLPISSPLIGTLMNNSTWILGGLAVLMLLLLLGMNFKLRKENTPPKMPIFSDTLSNSIE